MMSWFTLPALRPLSIFVAILALSRLAYGQTLSLAGGVLKLNSLTNTVVQLGGRCELWLTNSSPLSGCTVNLTSPDAWLFLPAVKPSLAVSAFLPQLRVSGATPVVDTNVRVVQHGAIGTVVIPHSSTFQPLQVFNRPHCLGASLQFTQHTYYRGAQFGAFNGAISSFRLRRGYMATLAQNNDGSGLSRNYVAQDGDLEVGVLPEALGDTIRFVYVQPWRWSSKKGSCDVAPADLQATWWYNWNINQTSPRDIQYVGIRQQPYWPSLSQDWRALSVNHLLGYNEPNNPVEDAYKNLSPPGSVSDAVARWPEMLRTGLRLGAPAVTDGGYSWIVDFINQAEAAGHRIDFVPVHYYRSYANNDYPQGAANSLYNYLKSIYDVVKRPIWVTEFNNGANWTGDADPTFDQNKNVIEAMINLMDTTPWIERYSIYSRVEEVRQTHYNVGGLTPMGGMYREHLAPLAYLQSVPDNGNPGVGLYRFDGDALDSSGNANHGVTSGSPAFTNGVRSQGIVFDGLNTRVTLPPNIAQGAEFTFAAWLRWDGGANWQRIFDFGNSTTHYLFLTPRSGGSTLRFAIKNGGSEQIVETTALPQNQWRHVALTLSGGTARLYVNGVQVAANTGVSITPAQFKPRLNFLGDSQFSADPLYSGLMDELLIADQALAPAQIAALQTNTPPQFSAPSLTRAPAAAGSLYWDTIAGTASDANPGDRLAYSRLTGPGWLSVSADGDLGGIPSQADVGSNVFTLQVTDSAGLTAFSQLSILVTNAPGMTARFDFDGTLAPSVGTARASLTGPATYLAGRAGQAIALDGVTNFLRLSKGIGNLDDFTIATWVYWNGGPAWQRIFDFGNGTSDYMLLTPNSGSNLRFSICVGAGTAQELNASVLPTGSWQHLAITRAGGIARLYLNGAQVALNSAMTFKPSDFNPSRNYLGKSQFTADPLFNGRLDGFCVYNHALSAAQVAALHTKAPPRFTNDPLLFTNAIPAQPYSNTVAGAATNVTPGGPVNYALTAGPRWLSLNPDGAFTGVAGKANIGPNTFTLRATDDTPLSDEAALHINVAPGPDAAAVLGFESSVTNSCGINHGIAFGSPLFVPGVNGSALAFDGTNDYVTLPAGLLNLNEITIATWVHCNSSNGDWQRVFDFGSGTNQYLFLTPRSPSGRIRFAITTSGGNAEQSIESSAVPLNQWTHLALTLQGGNSGRLYVNGSLVASNTITLRPSSINPTLNYLGKSQWLGDAPLNANLDDFQIYNRPMSPFEIVCLAHPGRDSDRDGWTDSAETDADLDADSLPNYLDGDNDGDNIPDAWEIRFGLNQFSAADAAADPDADGQTNLAEYIAGTRPHDSTDFFAQTVVPGAPLTVAVPGAPGRTYILWRTQTFQEPWLPVLTNGPVAAPGLLFLADPASPTGTAFYRTSVSVP